MTNCDVSQQLSTILYSNSQINRVQFDQRDFTPTDRGHGLFVKTLGGDTLIDLRMASEKPFLGHTHPLVIQHNFNKLKYSLVPEYYSIQLTDFTKMTEGFQKIHFSELFTSDFTIAHHDVAIFIDEDILKYSDQELLNIIANLTQQNPETYFWIIEQDITLCNTDRLFFSQKIMNNERIRLGIQIHFLNSIFIQSQLPFPSDNNIQIFFAIKNYMENVISASGTNKNANDFKILDDFFRSEMNTNSIQRKGRYLILDTVLDISKLQHEGILISNTNIFDNKTILAFPIAATTKELDEACSRIKRVL